MKKYIAIFEVSDGYKPSDFVDTADGWFTDENGDTQAVGTKLEESKQVDCENCDFRKFTETFVDGVVDVMNKHGITSVEQLSEILKGGAE